MANNDGSLNFDTKIDSSGFEKGLSGIGSAAQKGLSVTTKVMAGAATAIAGIGAASVKVGMEFEAAMSQVAATMGITANTIAEDGTKPFEILAEAAKAAGASTQYSASEAAQALNYLALAGYDASTAAEVLPSVLNLAAAGGMDLAYASDLATDAMSALGIAASNENLTSFGDKLAVTAQKSNTSVSQLGEAILTVGATAKDLAGGTTELNTSLGMLADSGIKGAEGGTHLRNVILSLQSPTDAAAASLEKYTNGVYDAQGNMRPLNVVLGELNDSLSDMTQAGRTDVINQIFNKTDLAAAQVLLAGCAGGATDLSASLNGAAVDLTLFNSNMEGAMNICNQTMVAEMELESQLDEGIITLDEYNSQYDVLFDNAYKALGPLKDVGVTMSDIENATNSGDQLYLYASAINEVSSEAEKAKYAEQIFGESVSDLEPLLNSGITDMDEMRAYAENLGLELDSSGSRFNELSGYIDGSSGAMQSMADTMNDNLQGDLKTLNSALEGLGISLYESVDNPMRGVTQTATDMVKSLSDAFKKDGFDGFVGVIGDVLAQVVEEIAEAAPTLIDAAVNLVDSFCDGLKSAPGIGESGAKLITSLVTGLMSCVGEIWTTAIVLMGKLAGGIAEGAPQMIQAASMAIIDIVECIADWLPDFLQAGGSIIMALADGVAGMLPVLAGHAVTITSTLFDTLMSALPQAAAMGADLLNQLAEGIAGNLPAMIPAAMSALVEFSSTLRSSAGQLVDAGLNLIMTLAQSLIDNIPVFIKTIPTIITNIAGIINDNAPKLLTAGMELIGKLAMGLIQAIPTLVSNIPQIIQAVVSVFTAFNWLSLGKNIITFITNGIKSLATSIPNALKSIGQTAKDWLRTINWRTLGSDIIDLIVIGVKSLATAIPNLLKSIGSTAVNFFKSIDWLDLGINVIKGLIAGITGALDGLWDAVGGLCSGVLDKIKGFFGIHSPSTVMAEQGDFLVQGLVNGIASMPAELAAYLDQTVQKIIAWGQQMFSNVQNIIQNVVNTAVNLIAQLPGKIWTWLVNVVTKTVQWGQQMLTTATTAIQNMISSIISLLSQLPGKVWTWFASVIAKAVEWGRQMLDNARTATSSMISAIISLLSELPGKVWTWLANTAAKVVEWGRELASKGAEAARGLFDAVVNGVSSLPSKMAEVGSNIVTGIWNGISSGWDWLKGKVADVANSLLDTAKGALGINSPSKAFRDEFGRWLMPGTVEGVKESMPAVLRDMQEQAGELLAAMQGTVAASMGEITLNASGAAGARALTSAGTVVYNDNHMEQENNYHVKTATAAEVNKAQREAFRKFAGGVK